MKQGVHPKTHYIKVKCSACGAVYIVLTTTDVTDMHLPVCAKCHPAFTGGPIDTKRMTRVQQFMKKWGYKLEQQEEQKEQAQQKQAGKSQAQ